MFFLLKNSLVFACLGFLSPANRGALMTCAVVLWVLLGTPAGYVAARLYKGRCFVTFVSTIFTLRSAVSSNHYVFWIFSFWRGEVEDQRSADCLPLSWVRLLKTSTFYFIQSLF